MTSLHELIDQRFGLKVRSASNRETTAMTTTAALVLRNDSSRLAALVINLGASVVHLRPSGIPTATAGVRLTGNGGFVTLQWDEDFTLVGEEWNGITLTGTSTLFILETLIEP